MAQRAYRQVETGKFIIWTGDKTVGNSRQLRWWSPRDWLSVARWLQLPATRRHRWASDPLNPNGPAN